MCLQPAPVKPSLKLRKAQGAWLWTYKRASQLCKVRHKLLTQIMSMLPMQTSHASLSIWFQVPQHEGPCPAIRACAALLFTSLLMLLPFTSWGYKVLNCKV